MLFDNRELAILIWLAIALVLVLVWQRTRPAVLGVAKAFVQPKLVIYFWLPILVYVGLVIWGLALLDIWTTDLISETIFWFLGPAAILFARFEKASEDPTFLRRGLRSILEITILVEFLINLYPLNLVAELFLVPVLVILATTLAYATLKPEYRQAKVLLDLVLAFAGFALLIYGIGRIIRDPLGFATADKLREFVVPILLTFALAPFVYLVAVLATYEQLFSLLNWKLSDNRPLARYAKWKLFLATLFRLRALRRFNQFPWRVVSNMDRRAVRGVVERFKAGNTRPAPWA